MTVATKFLSWQNGRQPGTPYTYCSPSLKSIANYCIDRWHLTNLGCYGVRPIRGGTAWSSHAFGAAVDLGYTDRTVLEQQIFPFLIANSEQHEWMLPLLELRNALDLDDDRHLVTLLVTMKAHHEA